MKNASLTTKSSSLSNGWPMKWLRGRCPTNWYQGQRFYVWYLKKLYKWCHSNNQVMSIKNARYKPQPSIQKQAFASMRSTPFIEIDAKGGEIVQRYESFWKDWDKEVEFGHGHKQRGGATLKDVKGSKFLDKRSTQVGGASSWTLIDCIWYVHIHVLACSAYAFKFNMHDCVVYASCRIWLMKWKLACIGW